jgi:ribosomal protein S18 acetylase RimI-like enzyme
MSIKIRKAKKSDAKAFLGLILELAEFEKLPPPDKKAQKRLIKDTFSDKPLINVLLAFDKSSGNKPVGYAIYFFTYSSFRAKPTLYLEDIYISADYRSKGIGQMYMDELKKIAEKKKCGRMEWVVLDWNVNAIKFYDKFGAKPMNDWITYRMDL